MPIECGGEPLNFPRKLVLALAAIVGLSSCGYHVGGRADLVPKSVQTIAIPAFANVSTTYKLGDSLPQAIGREFVTRSRFRVDNDASTADAILRGTITNVSYGYSSVSQGGVATTLQVNVTVNINLVERSTGRVLYSRQGYGVGATYNINTNPRKFFDESSPAFDRLQRELARGIVSAVLESF